MVGQRNNYNLRNASDITVPLCRLSSYQNSFFPSTVGLWNSLPTDLRELPNKHMFKSSLKDYFICQGQRPPSYFNTGSRMANILHTRLRRRCSSLNSDLFRCNLIDHCHCTCGNSVETVEHFFMHCTLYVRHRVALLNGLNRLGFDFTIENILFGNPDFDCEQNTDLFILIQNYICATKRFV